MRQQTTFSNSEENGMADLFHELIKLIRVDGKYRSVHLLEKTY